MEILKQKMLRLENYKEDITTKKNSNSTSVVYLTDVKLYQLNMVNNKKR